MTRKELYNICHDDAFAYANSEQWSKRTGEEKSFLIQGYLDAMMEARKSEITEKKKEVILTQDQINKMVHESCVLFCKHCGCGIPRETCISLGTCKEHDDYRKSIRTHLMEKKKKEYPKTYEEVGNIAI